MASDCLCPERDRPWPPPENGPVDVELDRFMADDGCGIAVFTFMPPSVCKCQLVYSYFKLP